MKIFKSIKWRLQIWYGLILLLVLAGFGFTAYQLARNQQFGRIDDELHRRVGVLAGALHHPPPHRREMDFDRPPPDQSGRFPNDDLPPPTEGRPLPAFHLPPESAHFFDADDPHDFYFRITHLGRDGKTVIANSTNFPGPYIIMRSSTEPVNDIPSSQFPPGPPKPLAVETFDHYRETAEMLPSGEFIQVGCSITPELHELKITALRLTVFGGVILLFGLVGGWWLRSSLFCWC